MVKDHSDSEKGNLLLPHGLLFPISSKGSFICTMPQTGYGSAINSTTNNPYSISAGFSPVQMFCLYLGEQNMILCVCMNELLGIVVIFIWEEGGGGGGGEEELGQTEFSGSSKYQN